MRSRPRPRRCYRSRKIPACSDWAALARDVIIFRHGSLRAADKALTWGSYESISEVVGLPVLKVKRICDLHAADQDLLLAFGPRVRRPHWQLEAQHFAFLLAAETLLAWQPHSIRARCRLFHRQFPDKRISQRRIRALYQ